LQQLQCCSAVSVYLQAADMARMTSSSSSPVPPVTPLGLLLTHKTSPSSTDTACSQDEDDQPLELTSHARLAAATCSVSTSSVSSLIVSSMSQPQLALPGNTLRWTPRGYEICPPTSVLFSAYCDTSLLMQTGTLHQDFCFIVVLTRLTY